MLDHVSKLPGFFILGAGRAGTASLAHYLGQHPSIHFTTPRDPHFFQRNELYQQGYDFYISTFCRNPFGKAWLGEATSAYFAAPHIVGPRLRAYYGDHPLKFIVLLREPVSRAWSHYLARVHHGCERRDFATALAEETLRDQASLAQDGKADQASYYGDGRYAYLLREWQTYYPLENFHFLLSEDLAANPTAQVRRVFAWLGVDTTMPVNVSARLNVARYARNPKMVELVNNPPAWMRKLGQQLWPETWQRHRIRHNLRERFQTAYGGLPPLDPAIAADLHQRYRGDILTLSKVLGRYLSHWLDEEQMDQVNGHQVAY